MINHEVLRAIRTDLPDAAAFGVEGHVLVFLAFLPSPPSQARRRHRKSSRATSASSVRAAENSAARSTLAIIWPIVFLAAATSTTSTC